MRSLSIVAGHVREDLQMAGWRASEIEEGRLKLGMADVTMIVNGIILFVLLFAILTG